MAKKDGIESVTFTDKQTGKSVTLGNGVVGESDDYSDYSTYWTIPEMVLAKRLTEPKSIRIVKNGVEGWLDGEPGHIHVVKISGNNKKETLYSQDEFESKFEQPKTQLPLLKDKEA